MPGYYTGTSNLAHSKLHPPQTSLSPVHLLSNCSGRNMEFSMYSFFSLFLTSKQSQSLVYLIVLSLHSHRILFEALITFFRQNILIDLNISSLHASSPSSTLHVLDLTIRSSLVVLARILSLVW